MSAPIPTKLKQQTELTFSLTKHVGSYSRYEDMKLMQTNEERSLSF